MLDLGLDLYNISQLQINFWSSYFMVEYHEPVFMLLYCHKQQSFCYFDQKLRVLDIFGGICKCMRVRVYHNYHFPCWLESMI